MGLDAFTYVDEEGRVQRARLIEEPLKIKRHDALWVELVLQIAVLNDGQFE